MDTQQNEQEQPQYGIGQNSSPYGNVQSLAEQGVDAQSIFDETNDDAVDETNEDNPDKAAAKKDMMIGALWCVGGIVATMSDLGVICWGAILFGGIQFFRGLVHS